ncbi:MAG: hypothetical protein IJ077_05980 [Eubacterium sp.]|nr:hypothetical protein [Eubacterium sp.]MBQ9229214.1 hypothetical protein [Eubacterium sp.]
MPIVPRRAQNALYELQEFCKLQNGNCADCALKYQCVFLWRKNMFCDLELPKQSDIVYGCRETETCSEFIRMHAEMNRRLNKSEELRKRTVIDNELLRSQRDSLVGILDRLCPDWKEQIGGKE